MIVSNDTIVSKPPYNISVKVLELIKSISERIGEINAFHLDATSPKLRKQSRIKTLHSTLAIEGNTLTKSQITALIENKRIIGPEKDITEVLNAERVYKNLNSFQPFNESSYLEAHKMLMNGLIKNPGNYRRQQIGIIKGKIVKHAAPPYKNVPYLMKDLFAYLKNSEDLILIKSCVFHYEMEFIHPFLDGNGRMGRLWQTLILMGEYPVFEFLPFETLISKEQETYYAVLAECDKLGHSTLFIEYMLDILNKSLEEILNFSNRTFNQQQRLEYFVSMGKSSFARKDYMSVFNNISSATASRDLKEGIRQELFEKIGEKNNTIYRLK
ncbi:MAG: Fic family protein [Bacteroidota bacterium]